MFCGIGKRQDRSQGMAVTGSLALGLASKPSQQHLAALRMLMADERLSLNLYLQGKGF